MTNSVSQRGMQRKTLRKVLRLKIEDWLDTIDDIEVRQIASENLIITGGCIPSLLMGDRVNDYDFYMRTKESAIALSKYYVDKYNEANKDNTIEPYVYEFEEENIKGELEERVGIMIKSAGVAGVNASDDDYEYYEMTDNIHGDGASAYIDKMLDREEEGDLPKNRPVFLSQNAITLSNSVQLVIRFFGEPDKIHDNYDFQHAMCYYDYHNDELELPSAALEAMMSKTLYYKGSLYPICSLFRIRKFIERGWKISAGEILKISWQISEIDLSDVNTLRSQLTGVDAAYFHQVIRIIEHEKRSNELIGESFELDSTYVINLIDRIFGQ